MLRVQAETVMDVQAGEASYYADSLLMKQQLLIVNRSRRRVSLSLFGLVLGGYRRVSAGKGGRSSR